MDFELEETEEIRRLRALGLEDSEGGGISSSLDHQNDFMRRSANSEGMVAIESNIKLNPDTVVYLDISKVDNDTGKSLYYVAPFLFMFKISSGIISSSSSSSFESDEDLMQYRATETTESAFPSRKPPT